nr:RNA 2',3'-cyclic phosphodiesterase [Enterovibrio paralichthyis]
MGKVSKETRRLFFALDLSDAHNAASRDAIVGLKRQLAPQGRPVPDDNLHITLAFLGEVDSKAYRRLCETADTLTCPPLSLITTQTGYFPAQSILWLGIAENTALRLLAEKLQSAAAEILNRPAEHKFVPHISLLRRAKPTEAPLTLQQPLHFQRVGIYASVPLEEGHGVRYQCLNHWTLTD